MGMRVGRTHGAEHHDLLALVTGLGAQLLGLVDIPLPGQSRRTRVARHRRAASEERRLELPHLVPRLERLGDELERPRSDHLGDLLIGTGFGEPGMMNGTRHDTLARASSSDGNGSFSRIEKLLSAPFISSTEVDNVWPTANSRRVIP